MLLANIATKEEVVEEVSKVNEYVNEQIPKIFDFAIDVLWALVVFAIGSKLISMARKIAKRSMERSDLDVGVKQFVDSALKYGLYIVLFITIIEKFGFDTASFAALLASGGLTIGLALQGSLTNFVGGILILVQKPFVVGDYIIEDTNKCEGTVKEIQVFYTKLMTADNKLIVVPNGTLSNTSLTNVTAQDKRKLDLKIDISYDADLKKAKELIENILKTDSSVMKNEEILVFVSDLGASSVVIGARAWVKTEEYWSTKWRLLENIKMTLDENEIEIPYQQITVHVERQDV